MAKVTVEFSGRIELDVQGWSDTTTLNQIKKQAQDAVDHWTFMVKKGALDPVPVNFIRKTVTEVILPIKES